MICAIAVGCYNNGPGRGIEPGTNGCAKAPINVMFFKLYRDGSTLKRTEGVLQSLVRAVFAAVVDKHDFDGVNLLVIEAASHESLKHREEFSLQFLNVVFFIKTRNHD